MLTILGKPDRRGSRLCDGVSRRSFLKIGGMVMGGISLPELLRAEERGGVGQSHKAIINIFLPGGPPHQDMWDIKVEAATAFRGEFRPIKTNVPGIEICELFPKLANMMDKLVPIRSMVGCQADHIPFQCMTAKVPVNQPSGGWPSAGAWISKLQGPTSPNIPPHMSMFYKTDFGPWGDPGNGGLLGTMHAPFNLVAGKNQHGFAGDMVLQGITLDRLQDRRNLLTSLDNFRRQIDTSRTMEGMDSHMRGDGNCHVLQVG